MSNIDLILLATIVVVLPVWGVRHWQSMKAEAAAGRTDARLRAWLVIVFVEWALTALLLLGWADRGLPLSRLGVEWRVDRAFLIATGAVGVVAAFLLWQLAAVRRMAEIPEALARSIASVEAILPHDRSERRAFVAVALTAGFCEELLYRGFLIDWFAARWGIAAAVAASTLLFALGHAYQGVGGIVKTGAVGLVLAGLYLASGSIWLPMILHAVLDVNGGFVGHEVLRRRVVVANG